jgi:curved DNA-binding protein
MAQYEDLYKILNVSSNSSFEEIRLAYRTLARQYHPDLNPGNPVAEETFKQINIAYEILKDPNRRQKYDFLRRYGAFEPNIYNRNFGDFPETIDFEQLLNLMLQQLNEYYNMIFLRMRKRIRSFFHFFDRLFFRE